MNAWNALRGFLALVFLGTFAWVTVYDYPDGAMLWELVHVGNAYYLWEVLILAVGFHALAWWTFYLEGRFRCATPF